MLFDPRDPYPDVLAQNGKWKPDGFTHRMWKKVERVIITNASACIGVTPQYKDSLKLQGARQAYFVPNRAAVSDYVVADMVDLSEPMLLFTGVMDLAYYSPAVIAEHTLKLRRYVPRLRLKVITLSDAATVRMGLIEAGLPEDCFTVESAAPVEMPEKMKGAAIGLHFAIRWPVKYAEYLSAGIPLIMVKGEDHFNKAVEGRRLGIIVDPEKPESYSRITELLSNHQAYSKRCRAYAEHYLNVTSSAKQYIRIYKRLLDG